MRSYPGVAISAFLFIFTILSILLFFRRRRSKAKIPPTSPSTAEKGNSSTPLGVLHDKPGLDAVTTTFTELLALEEEKESAEISGRAIHGEEMDSEETAIKKLPVPEVYELPTDDFKEMPRS